MSTEPKMVYRWHPSVATRTLDGTAFILHGSRMLSLNLVGSRIWGLLETGATVDETGETIAAEFATTIEVATADSARFIDDLLARQILVLDSTEAEPAADSSSN